MTCFLNFFLISCSVLNKRTNPNCMINYNLLSMYIYCGNYGFIKNIKSQSIK